MKGMRRVDSESNPKRLTTTSSITTRVSSPPAKPTATLNRSKGLFVIRKKRICARQFTPRARRGLAIGKSSRSGVVFISRRRSEFQGSLCDKEEADEKE